MTLVISGNVLWISDYKMFLSDTASFKTLLETKQTIKRVNRNVKLDAAYLLFLRAWLLQTRSPRETMKQPYRAKFQSEET